MEKISREIIDSEVNILKRQIEYHKAQIENIYKLIANLENVSD